MITKPNTVNSTSLNRSNVIHVEGLTKYYGNIKGVENVNFTVKRGSIHGFLGPNGAGKTTTIRILIGLLSQDHGKATILGHQCGSKNAKKLIGYLPSDFGLYKHYTVKQYLDYIVSLRGDCPKREELVSLFKLDESKKTNQLSKGNRQKVSIVQALMHEPKLLIADEPTNGLDPLMQARFNDYLKEYVKKGGTVFISSHIIDDVQEICDQITVIRMGEIVSSGNIQELLENIPKRAKIRLVNGIDISQVTDEIPVIVGEKEFDRYTLFFDGSLRDLGKILASSPLIQDFILPDPSLEDYFMQFYAGDVI